METPSRPGFLCAARKRALDVALALVALLLLAPLMVVIALLVVIESPGPIFYRAERVGREGRRLEILKFRKMHAGARGGPLTTFSDQRFTRIGGWLSRTKLDELPQLLNVLRGDMSLIGPRPEDPAFVERFPERFAGVLSVRPGITGLAQLAFKAESQILDPDDPVAHYERQILPAKLRLDELYVQRLSSRLDLRILVWTLVTTVLTVPVSVHRSTARMSVRRGSGGRRQDRNALSRYGEPLTRLGTGRHVQPTTEEG